MELVAAALAGGLDALAEYLSLHVLTCLVPAFFLAGAMTVFLSRAAVLKCFGARAPRVLAYSVAAVSGTALAVCSCTVLPLFAGIHRRGAGLGPAIAFLFSGPAINVLAIVYTARLLGAGLGVARAAVAVVLATVLGLLMARIFRREELARRDEGGELALPGEERERPAVTTAFFFAALLGTLVFASAGRWLPAAASLLLVVGLGVYAYREDVGRWMRETWNLGRLIVPLLLAGVVLAGVLQALLPADRVRAAVGGNGAGANLVAALFGALMYFSTLTEVPIVRALVDLGMGPGPALALLLAGPSLSLPNMIVIGRVLGWRRTGVYVVLVVLLSAGAGMVFGALNV